MHTVIDPQFLFINQEDWDIEHKKFLFLEKFIEICDIVEMYPPISFCWSSQLEELLWSNPTIPPWKYYLKNQIVSIYYKKFFSNRTLFEESQNKSSSTPEIDWFSVNEDINNLYSNLVFSIVQSDISFILYLNQIRGINSISFSAHNKQYSPKLVFNSKMVLENVPYIQYYWDSIDEDCSIIRKCLDIQRTINGYSDFIYNIEFSKSFLKDISREQNERFKVKIIEQLTKKLCLTQQECARDCSLKDEYIEQSKCFRFRVTPRPSSCRIHYTYDESTILLKNYYSAGEHDDGL